MALTPSHPFPTGTLAPEFCLPDTVSGKNLSLQDVMGNNGCVIMFICNHCPFVIHVNEELVRLANEYTTQGIGFAAFSSNDIQSFPQDAPLFMTAHARNNQYPFPYLYDENQAVAKSYAAACTPDFYIFDAKLVSVYHGQLDDSRPGNGSPIDGSSMRQALHQLLHGLPPMALQKLSIGCGIKWK